MYYSFSDKIGGPLTYINTITQSKLKEKYHFVTCFQECAPGGINFRLLAKMVKQIRKENPDVVHVHGLQSEGFYGVLAAKIAGCRYIITTVHGFGFDGNISKWKKFLYRFVFEPLTLRMSHKVYCVCEYALKRKIITQNCKKNAAEVIYSPAPAMRVENEKDVIKEKHGIKAGDFIFIISSRLVVDKGYDVIADAIKHLNLNGNNKFKFIVLGDGPYKECFEIKLSQEISSKQVILVGETNYVADYLNIADVFVLPSYHENLPLSLIEAGTMGLAAVTSSEGGIPEIIQDGESGFIIDGFNAIDYADKMIFLMQNKEILKKMRDNAKKRVDDLFSMEKFCELLDEVYSNHEI